MKWLLLGILVSLILSRRYLLGGLARAVRGLPADYRRGQRQAEDPATEAKDVGPRPN